MNGDGTRFLFTTPGQRYAQNGIIELAIAEINPASLGAAPSIANPTVDPASIPGDGAGYRAIIIAKVTSSSPVVVATAHSFLQGLPDLVGTIMTVQRLALDHAGTLRELDINPLVVRPAGQGVVALDALMTC